MLQIMRSSRSVRGLLLVSVCLLVLNIVLPRSAEAVVKNLSIDDSLRDFTRGNFQRTALGALQVPDAGLDDEEGAVQLAPLGLLKDWSNSPFDLPERLIGMGTTAIGNRIFVIGGETFDGGESVPRANVWSGAIDTQTGAVVDPGWETEPPLPAVEVLLDDDTTIAEVSRPAVTSVARSGNSGYIYVMGGNVQRGIRSLSSFAVHIGVVGENGRITSWQEGPRIPSQDDNIFNQLGLQDASAISLNIDGTDYIYLIGGLQRFVSSGNVVGSPTKKIFYARVDAATGRLFKPGTSEEGWADAEAEIPIPGDGLWGAVATANRFVASNNAYALYIAGGRLDNGGTSDITSSENVYRATFGNDGRPTWDTAWSGTMPTSRFGHAGVEFRGNLYLTGGAQGSSDEPDREVLTSYVQDDLSLPSFGDPGSNFLPNDALPDPRLLHGSVVVATDEGTAFVYVIGGRGDTTDGDTSDDQGTDDVIFGKVGGIDEIEGSDYAPNAWYYSQPFRITFDQAQVRNISWSTLMTQTDAINMDIALDYRVSNAEDCNNAGWTDQDWQLLDGAADPQHRSQNGRNEVDVGNPQARCFQYRARLSTDNTPFTPSLLNVNIQIVIPGSPDLKPVDFRDVRGGDNNRTLIGLDAFVLNQNEFEETLAADVEAPGDFYVDICISSGVNVQPPTIPLPDSGGCTQVYAKVAKSVMGVNVRYQVREWLDFTNDQPMTSEKFNALFPQVGTYTVYIAVDSTNFVNEGTLGGEDNNIASLQLEVFPDPEDPTKPDVDFRVESPGLLLPIIGQ